MGNSIYRDIAERTKGSVYIGVIGPVRTGKSTFIKRFMDTIVIPNMDGDFEKERALDKNTYFAQKHEAKKLMMQDAITKLAEY